MFYVVIIQTFVVKIYFFPRTKIWNQSCLTIMDSNHVESDKSENEFHVRKRVVEASCEEKECESKNEHPENKFCVNKYATTSTVTRGILNTALLTSNANQLKITISDGPDRNSFYGFIIVLCISSIILQTSMAILAVLLGKEDINLKHRQKNATRLNGIYMILEILTAVINALLAVFGRE